MIVDESSILLAALEQRFQVGRVLPLDPLRANGAPEDASPGQAATDRPAESLVRGPPEPSSTPAEDRPLAPGRIIAARVVEVQPSGRIVLALEDLVIELDHGGADGPLPRPGQTMTFRVLADRPVLLLQTVPPDTEPARPATGTGPLVHWSADVLRLQTFAGGPPEAHDTARIVRFAAPLLDSGAADIRTGLAPHAVIELPGDPAAATPQHGEDPLDGTPAAPRPAIDPGFDASRLLPLVFQGPAWVGQMMELVVRREAADESMANPALDHWCGEVVLDLPQLGRVAGHLAFSMQGLRIRLEADDDAAVALLTGSSAQLASACADAGLRVTGVSVGRPLSGAVASSAA